MKRPERNQLGSLTVELVVMTPVLLVLALGMLGVGRVSEARQQVVEAARAGAESAAVLPTAGIAGWGAAVDAAIGASVPYLTCGHQQVRTDLSHFYPGGSVTVTVICHVPLADIALPGMPGSTTVQASATAPIDPYRSVG
ncbi:MAG: TadE family protein [Acidimicrobiales bacterium]